MQLLLLLSLLTIPSFVLTLINRWSSVKIKPSTRARVGLSVFFAFTAIGHFIRTDEMSAMLPPWVPYRGSIIYLTGVLELLGAIGVWLPGLTRLTGLCLILMLITFFPANNLFGNQSNRIRRARSGSVLFAGASPVSTISDPVDSLVDRTEMIQQVDCFCERTGRL